MPIVSLVLDKSGSMSSVRDATISGVNEYIDSLKRDKKTKYKFSLTLFDSAYTTSEIVDIEKTNALSLKSYDPFGTTALYDAVCTAIDGIKQKRGKKIVVIVTDGLENSSREYNKKDFASRVKELTEKGWVFVYLGANQDAWDNASQWGFMPSNVATFNATDKGVEAVFNVCAMSTRNIAGSSLNENFFTEDVKTKLENAV